MRFSVLILFLLVANTSINAQSKDHIISWFKKKQVDSILTACDYPFTLAVKKKVVISDPTILRREMNKLLKGDHFAVLSAGKRKESGDNLIYEGRSYNGKGEMESEFALVFSFKRSKDKKWKLYDIMAAD